MIVVIKITAQVNADPVNGGESVENIQPGFCELICNRVILPDDGGIGLNLRNEHEKHLRLRVLRAKRQHVIDDSLLFG